MMTRPFLFALLSLLVLVDASSAQTPQQPAAPTVTVSATSAGVRFVALGSVRQTRLEVYDSSGSPVFDSGFLPGNVRDWAARAAGLADGAYTCVLTARDLAGRLSLKQGAVVLSGGQLSLALGEAEAAGAVKGDEAAPTSAAGDEAGAATLATHDGRDGAVTSTSGALTLRTGDVLRGEEREHVRVTPEGRVGVGTDRPETTLDVAGAIRAADGFRFPDGTTLSSKGGRLTLTDAQGGESSPLTAAAGTANRLAKFDSGGALVDSAVAESAGRVGIGVASPGDLLDIAGAPNASGRSGIRVRTTSSTGNSTLYFDNDRGDFSSYGGLLTGATANPFSFFGVARADRTFLLADGPTSLGLGLGTLTPQPVLFGTANTERMRITPTGDVGIGIPNPQARLHVAGAVNASQFNIGGNRVVAASGDNTFVGNGVGASNTGSGNSFFGRDAGLNNTTGSSNSFFGTSAGYRNTIGALNAFFGDNAGSSNETGNQNAFFGTSAGSNNKTGFDNAFFGAGAGINNTTGSSNSFFGFIAGLSNTTESNNIFIGASSDGAAGITNAIAIGFKAKVTQSNSLVLGSISNVNGATADTNVGIGTTAPAARLHIAVNSGQILLGHAGCGAGHTGIGFGSTLSGCTNYSLLGNGTHTFVNRPSGGGIFFRESNIDQVSIASGGAVTISQTLAVSTLGSAGSQTLCRNASNQIADCSSSVRYKERVAPFLGGLDLVRRLRPVSFTWRAGGQRDLGFVAEEVSEAEPLLVTHDEEGEVEGVKYDRISAVLVNAVREQQGQIEEQRRQIEQRDARIIELEARLGGLERGVRALSQRGRRGAR